MRPGIHDDSTIININKHRTNFRLYGERVMDIQSHCDGMSGQLVGWKAKFDEMATKFDHASTGDKSNVVGFVNDFNMVLEEMGD